MKIVNRLLGLFGLGRLTALEEAQEGWFWERTHLRVCHQREMDALKATLPRLKSFIDVAESFGGPSKRYRVDVDIDPLLIQQARFPDDSLTIYIREMVRQMEIELIHFVRTSAFREMKPARFQAPPVFDEYEGPPR